MYIHAESIRRRIHQMQVESSETKGKFIVVFRLQCMDREGHQKGSANCTRVNEFGAIGHETVDR